MVEKKNSFIIELIGRWGKFKIYLVDDEAIRNKAEYAEEFSDYGVNIERKDWLRSIFHSFLWMKYGLQSRSSLPNGILLFIMLWRTSEVLNVG